VAGRGLGWERRRTNASGAHANTAPPIFTAAREGLQENLQKQERASIDAIPNLLEPWTRRARMAKIVPVREFRTKLSELLI
jgi:hypothetical protein